MVLAPALLEILNLLIGNIEHQVPKQWESSQGSESVLWDFAANCAKAKKINCLLHGPDLLNFLHYVFSYYLAEGIQAGTIFVDHHYHGGIREGAPAQPYDRFYQGCRPSVNLELICTSVPAWGLCQPDILVRNIYLFIYSACHMYRR